LPEGLSPREAVNPCRIPGADQEHPAERPVLTVAQVFALAAPEEGEEATRRRDSRKPRQGELMAR
jgi:hypothetical protein